MFEKGDQCFEIKVNWKALRPEEWNDESADYIVEIISENVSTLIIPFSEGFTPYKLYILFCIILIYKLNLIYKYFW